MIDRTTAIVVATFCYGFCVMFWHLVHAIGITASRIRPFCLLWPRSKEFIIVFTTYLSGTKMFFSCQLAGPPSKQLIVISIKQPKLNGENIARHGGVQK